MLGSSEGRGCICGYEISVASVIFYAILLPQPIYEKEVKMDVGLKMKLHEAIMFYIFCGPFLLYFICQFISATIFYLNNGFDFSKDLGFYIYKGDSPPSPEEEKEFRTSPQVTYFFLLPIFILGFGIFHVISIYNIYHYWKNW